MPTTLITGSSSGIGYELAKLFAVDHYDLVLIARNQSALDKLAEELRKQHGISVKVIAKDLSQNRVADEIFEELQRESIRIDVLVNNAGFGTFGLFADTELQATLEVMQVNMV